jgi:hypothetical protein
MGGMADGQDNATPGIGQARARQVLLPHAVRQRPGGLARIPGGGSRSAGHRRTISPARARLPAGVVSQGGSDAGGAGEPQDRDGEVA